MANDDIGHGMREQMVTVLLDVKQRDAGAHEDGCAERKTGGVERCRDDAECGQRALLLWRRHRMRKQSGIAKQQQQAGGAKSENHGQRHDTA